jgi:hypothetical protein
MTMKKIINKLSSSKSVVYLLYLIARVYLLTLTIKIENEGKWLDQINKGESILFCLFHQQLFLLSDVLENIDAMNLA